MKSMLRRIARPSQPSFWASVVSIIAIAIAYGSANANANANPTSGDMWSNERNIVTICTTTDPDREPTAHVFGARIRNSLSTLVHSGEGEDYCFDFALDNYPTREHPTTEFFTAHTIVSASISRGGPDLTCFFYTRPELATRFTGTPARTIVSPAFWRGEPLMAEREHADEQWRVNPKGLYCYPRLVDRTHVVLLLEFAKESDQSRGQVAQQDDYWPQGLVVERMEWG